MLALTRKVNQKTTIVVGETTIVVNIAEVHGDKVRLSFDAPADVKIWRNELLAALEYEAAQAAKKQNP